MLKYTQVQMKALETTLNQINSSTVSNKERIEEVAKSSSEQHAKVVSQTNDLSVDLSTKLK